MARSQRLLTPELLRDIRSQFRLDWSGHHGFPHWARVYRHGLHVGRSVGADLRVVELFAFLHDSQRENEYEDPQHGHRAAEYACWLHRKRRFELDAVALDQLVAACKGHSDGHIVAAATVMACWDADRLDLGRVNVCPDPLRLCTEAARDPSYLEHAWRRGQSHYRRLLAGERSRPWRADEDGVVHLEDF